MAGQAVLASFMQVLFEKLIRFGADEVNLICGVRGQLHSLAETLSAVQVLLEDAEEKQFNDASIKSWLAKLKDVSYDMDDLLEDFAAEQILLNQTNGDWRRNNNNDNNNNKLQLINFISCFTNIYYCCCCCQNNYHINYRFARRVRGIQERFSRIARERDELGLQVLGGATQIQIASRPQTSSLVDEFKVFGREEEAQAIVKMLLDNSTSGNRGRVRVLPIVGMGGLGKTTLAQSVYNDERIRGHFQLRMWICVSDNFDEMKLTKETLHYAAHSSAFNTTGFTSCVSYSNVLTNMNMLQEDLYRKLKEQRFLLVLDDVWNEESDRWDCYRKAFFAAAEGSAVIVTTQNSNVGRIMGGLDPYNLKQLSDEDCWMLFKNYAFVGGDCTAHPNLEKIGMDIVKKLKGLPLAAKAIGSLLYSKVDDHVWRDILKNEIWELPRGKHNILLRALRLSYKHLPSPLKQCFAFCSVYHKDFIFRKDRLVKIWIALGFIQAQGKKRLEDIGSSYFDELVSRSFFQPYKGNYVMHDALHDLAQSLSAQESYKLGDDRFRINPEKVRHLQLSSNKLDSFQEVYEFKKLRTLLLLRGYRSKISQIPDDLFLRLRCLRVLDLYRREIKQLPDSLGDLIQLRYLSLSGTEITGLPMSIDRLYNLQALILKYCNLLTEIPNGITKLSNLRHLEASSTLISEIAGIGRLTSLQELEEFIVRKKKGHSIAELEGMMQLQGQLNIRNLENVVDSKEASKARLGNKECLKVLCLNWDDERIVHLQDDRIVHLQEELKVEEILDALQPHYELKELKINGYAGTKFPNWLGIPLFCYLETISLSNCQRCQVLPALGQLPLLKYLDMGGFQTLTKIDHLFYGFGNVRGFPKLIELILQDIPQLECWILKDNDMSFPCLSDLEIVDCPKLSELPRLPCTLTRLRVAEAGVDTLPEMQNLNTASLLTIDIHDCPNLTSLQEGLLNQQHSNLKQLRITDCEELVTLPTDGFHNLASLKNLHIHNCPKMTGWEDGRRLLPGSLEDLQIISCTKLINQLLVEAKYLSCLQYMKIAKCPDLRNLQLPVSLKVLEILECENIQNLPAELRELTSLTSLLLRECKQLVCLPYLPSGLQELRIVQCPLLKERVEVDDWHKIAHIPFKEIDGVALSLM